MPKLLHYPPIFSLIRPHKLSIASHINMENLQSVINFMFKNELNGLVTMTIFTNIVYFMTEN